MENLYFNKFVCMKKNLKDRFLSGKKFIMSRSNDYEFNGKETKIITEEWLDEEVGSPFFIQNIDGIVELFLIPEDSNIFVNKDFLDVTHNPVFLVDNILSGSVVQTNTYIEGADGTGKTTAVNGLASRGVMTTDRCVQHITKVMNQDDRGLIVNSVQSFLEANPTSKVIFLYVSDREEHYKRIFSREMISAYDRTAFDLQEKYLYAYDKLKHFKNLYLVDTYNKSPEQVQYECEKIALSEAKNQEQEECQENPVK